MWVALQWTIQLHNYNEWIGSEWYVTQWISDTNVNKWPIGNEQLCYEWWPRQRMSDSRMNKGHWNEWINQNEWVTPFLMSDSFLKEWLLFWKTATPLWMKWGSMPFFLPSLKFCLIIFVNKECYILPIKLTTNTGLTCITSRSDCPEAWLMFGVGPLSLDRWTDRTKANFWI